MTLDPQDWPAFRELAHRALDETLDAVAGIRERPPWREIPSDVRAAIAADPLPRTGVDPAAVYAEFLRNVAPYAVDNRHPRFFGWVHGAGTPAGIVAALLAAGMNANVGGRNHAAVEVERRVIGWWREIFGFPEGASGIVTTGSSMANVIGILVARRAAGGAAVRTHGVGGRELTAYASPEAHSSVARALDLAGIGREALRTIAFDAGAEPRDALLRAMIAADRAAGKTPFLIVATAGSASTGGFDDLAMLADCARDAKLWLHVDGAFGALARLAPGLRARVAGIERADSLAFDLHKWLHVPYDCGVVLVRDGALHAAAFADQAPYLTRAARGAAAGEPWPTDFGPELSRGFRALGAWFAMKTFGLEAYGALIEHQCAMARELAERIAETPQLELLAPVTLNIVCFRYLAPRADAAIPDEVEERRRDAFNARLVVELQERGLAVPSTTRVGGKLAIRMNVMNHRTTEADLEATLAAVLDVGRELLEAPSA